MLDGRLIVVGGEGNAASASGVFDASESFDPATGRWTTLERMRTPRHGTGAVGVNGRLIVPGGASVEGFGAVGVNEALRVE